MELLPDAFSNKSDVMLIDSDQEILKYFKILPAKKSKMSNNTLILGLQWETKEKEKLLMPSENVYAVYDSKLVITLVHNKSRWGSNRSSLDTIRSSSQNVKCLIGNGVVLSLEAIKKEIEGLEEFGVEIRDRLYISGNCPLILQVI